MTEYMCNRAGLETEDVRERTRGREIVVEQKIQNIFLCYNFKRL